MTNSWLPTNVTAVGSHFMAHCHRLTTISMVTRTPRRPHRHLSGGRYEEVEEGATSGEDEEGFGRALTAVGKGLPLDRLPQPYES